MSGVLRATSADITTVNATDVNAQSVDATPVKSGQIIEYLSRPCDGGNLVGQMGSFPTQLVSGKQSGTSYVDLNGSVISYQPPVGTSVVIYRFHFMTRREDDHAISHYRFYIDGNEIVNARETRSARQQETKYSFEWPIHITGVRNDSTGTVVDWNAPKELKIQARQYGSSNGVDWHVTTYFDGGGSAMFSQPVITLIAIA